MNLFHFQILMKWFSWKFGVFKWPFFSLPSEILSVLKSVLLKTPRNGTTLKYCSEIWSIFFFQSVFESSSTSTPEIVGRRRKRRRKACVVFIVGCRLHQSWLPGLFLTHDSPTYFSFNDEKLFLEKFVAFSLQVTVR